MISRRNRRHLKKIDPDFASIVEQILEDLKAMGWKPVIAESLRTIAQQREKVRKGYSKTMNSYHLRGLAVDIIDKRYGWGGPAADLNFKFWRDLGNLARRHYSRGVYWGGDWKSFKDVAHVQYKRR